jgi:hypothetical protein
MFCVVFDEFVSRSPAIGRASWAFCIGGICTSQRGRVDHPGPRYFSRPDQTI